MGQIELTNSCWKLLPRMRHPGNPAESPPWVCRVLRERGQSWGRLATAEQTSIIINNYVIECSICRTSYYTQYLSLFCFHPLFFFILHSICFRWSIHMYSKTCNPRRHFASSNVSNECESQTGRRHWIMGRYRARYRHFHVTWPLTQRHAACRQKSTHSFVFATIWNFAKLMNG